MLFCSETFLLFFVVVFALYWAMPWPRARIWLLLGASFYFYASWNEWLALLICVSTVIDYHLSDPARDKMTIALAQLLQKLSPAAAASESIQHQQMEHP